MTLHQHTSTQAEQNRRYAQAAAHLKALAHPLRLRIVELLEAMEVSVGALEDQLELPQAIISQQLAVLRRAGLVQVRRQGTAQLYRLTSQQTTKLVKLAELC
ncbi:MAG TPA: metalloregulator ArsR/SmtB family transcription factor [Candidatus Saccharimonadia bacterium]|nr:metalloregulator ArsR/SmtB family transcription factor [Candidatus Saccharimonadia bacterium]